MGGVSSDVRNEFSSLDFCLMDSPAHGLEESHYKEKHCRLKYLGHRFELNHNNYFFAEFASMNCLQIEIEYNKNLYSYVTFYSLNVSCIICLICFWLSADKPVSIHPKTNHTASLTKVWSAKRSRRMHDVTFPLSKFIPSLTEPFRTKNVFFFFHLLYLRLLSSWIRLPHNKILPF